jgi:type IV secretion system protein TrbD
MDQDTAIAGFYAPVHRALTESILLRGAARRRYREWHARRRHRTRSSSLDRRRPHLACRSHRRRVGRAKRDAAFIDVVRRHLRYPQHMVA